jgi:hypothetical protein
VKRAISVWYDGKIFLLPRRQHFLEKFFRCPFQYPKVPLEAGAPPDLLMLPTPLEINLVFPRTHACIILYIYVYHIIANYVMLGLGYQ